MSMPLHTSPAPPPWGRVPFGARCVSLGRGPSLGRVLLCFGPSVPFCSALPGLRADREAARRRSGPVARLPGRLRRAGRCPRALGCRPCPPRGARALCSSPRPSGTEEPPWAAGTGGGTAATSQEAPAVVNTARGAAGSPVKVVSLCAHAARAIRAPQLLSWARCGGCRCPWLPWLCSAVFPGRAGISLGEEQQCECVTPSFTPPAPGRGGSWVPSDLAVRAGNAGSAVRFGS